MQAVIQREIPMDYGIWKSVSPECRDLIQAMLTRDPAQRISAADAMQHSWFRNFGIGAPQSQSRAQCMHAASQSSISDRHPARRRLRCLGTSYRRQHCFCCRRGSAQHPFMLCLARHPCLRWYSHGSHGLSIAETGTSIQVLSVATPRLTLTLNPNLTPHLCLQVPSGRTWTARCRATSFRCRAA